jgi:hypothetical protein
MVNSEILGGLKLALSKGESFKQAMITFYNAGYKKEEIEEAARILQSENIEQKEISQKPETPLKQRPIQKSSKPKKSIQKVSIYGKPTEIKSLMQQEEPATTEQFKEIKTTAEPKKEISQKVSSYENIQKPKGKLIIILLIFFLLFLLGSLVAVFLFKQELIDFFNKLS